MELVAKPRDENFDDTLQLSCIRRQLSGDKENRPQLEAKTLAILCNALSLSSTPPAHDKRPPRPDGFTLLHSPSDTKAFVQSNRVLVENEDPSLESQSVEKTRSTDRLVSGSTRFPREATGPVQIQAPQSSDATSNSQGKPNRSVKLMEIPKLGLDVVKIHATTAFPAGTEGPGGLTLSLASSNFIPHHNAQEEELGPKSRSKSTSPHPMSPLAEITEAYTELQGGWKPASEAFSSEWEHEYFPNAWNVSNTAGRQSLQPTEIQNKSKGTIKLDANYKINQIHRGKGRSRQAKLSASSSQRLPLPTAPSLLRI